jgi:hypothetical protein
VKRPIWAFLGAAALFSIALLASRLVDLGFIPGDEFGAGDWKRRPVVLELFAIRGEGAPRSIDSGDAAAIGDRLRLRYNRTRYPYLWLIEVDAAGKLTALVPADPTDIRRWGWGTAHVGETIEEEPTLSGPPGERVLLAMFTPIPRRLDELQKAADNVEAREPTAIAHELDLAGQRFVYKLTVTSSVP